jgi:hypothetical protein
MEDPTLTALDAAQSGLPDYLDGLEWPATKDDAIMHAAEHGAPEHVLEYMERLPAAVFTSEAGMQHAFLALDSVDLGALVDLGDDADEAEDGTSS